MAETSKVWELVEIWMSTLDWPPSQRKMAERLEVDKSTITDWKYGRGPLPPREVMERLAVMIRTRYRLVLGAFMADHGYLDTPGHSPKQIASKIASETFRERGLAGYFDAEADDDTPASGSA